MRLIAVRFVALVMMAGLTCTLLTSCWGAREIDQLAMIAAMGVDKDENGVKLTVQIIVGGGGAGGEGEGSGAPVWVTSSKGNSLAEAVFNLNKVVSKTPFWAHSYVLIIGEDFAKDGIAEVLEWTGRDRQVRNSLLMAIAIGKAEDILKVKPKLTQLPAEYIETLLRLGAKTGYIPDGHSLRVHQAYANQPAMQVKLPLIQPQPQEDTGGSTGGENPAGGDGASSGSGSQEEKPESVELKGIAIFKSDKMVGTLDLQESRGVAWLTGEISDTLIAISRQEGQVTQRVNFARVKYGLRQNDTVPVLEARVSQDGELTSWPVSENFSTTPTSLKQLENDLTRIIEEEIRAALTKLQGEYNSDIIGLGEQIRRLDANLYKSLNWEHAFPTLQLATEINASFRRIGLTKK